jgi:8-oxo-dGTP pyrophosphatase MutT (NUDIX family)
MLVGDIVGFFEARDMDPNKRFGDSVDPDWEPTDPQDRAHNDAMKQTGFWGAQGAGVVFLARDTRRLLLAHRSEEVEQPGTWGTWGGAIDAGEDPETAARREAAEETGRRATIQRMVPLFVFRKGSFRYSNFLAVVDHEFTPRLGWETQDYRWCELDRWPAPLHFGFKAILTDPASVATMRRVRTELLAD